MKSILVAGTAMAMLACFPAQAQSVTCADIITSADQESMAQTAQELRTVAFQVSAKQHAATLYKALEKQGVRDPLFVVLDQYETTYVPVRTGAEAAFAHLVSTTGSLRSTVAKLCPQRETDLLRFYMTFYDSVLDRYSKQTDGS